MNTKWSFWSAGITLLGLGLWAVLAGRGSADDSAALKDGVLKIANGIKKGDTVTADAMAAKLAKKVDDLGDLMELFKKRDKGGIGAGSKAGAVIPDGIEIKLVTMGRDAPSSATAKKEAAGLEEMGYVIAAMAKVTKNKMQSGAKAKDWNGWCDDMAKNGLKLSEIAKSTSAADLKTIATKINGSCNACHSAYRK
jgi:hypothetical protein